MNLCTPNGKALAFLILGFPEVVSEATKGKRGVFGTSACPVDECQHVIGAPWQGRARGGKHELSVCRDCPPHLWEGGGEVKGRG